MTNWTGWPLQRLFYVFLGVAYLVVWAQVTLYHGRVDFHESAQWGPVIYTPLMVLAAFLYAALRAGWTRSLYLVLYVGGVIVGLLGIYFHFHGVAEMEGGLTLENFQWGPPVLLALTYTALSAMALLVAMWPLRLQAGEPREQVLPQGMRPHYR